MDEVTIEDVAPAMKTFIFGVDVVYTNADGRKVERHFDFIEDAMEWLDEMDEKNL